jgi:serine/threonine-protein kinase
MLLSNPYSESWPAASPDGRWLAYQSNESGREEIYVRPLLGAGTRRQISRRGGVSPSWGRSGRKLFFESAAGDSLFAAAITFEGEVEVQHLESVVPLRQSGLGFGVFPGDSAFVVLDPPPGSDSRARPAVVVYNFLAELEARLGVAAK